MSDIVKALREAAEKTTKRPLHVEPWNGYELKFQVMAAPGRRTNEYGQTETSALVFGRFSREEDATMCVLACNSIDSLLDRLESAERVVEAAKNTEKLLTSLIGSGFGELHENDVALKGLRAALLEHERRSHDKPIRRLKH